MKKKIPYGIASYEDIKKENYYYVDKTKHIEYFESLGEKVLFFTRSRRLGEGQIKGLVEAIADTMKNYISYRDLVNFSEKHYLHNLEYLLFLHYLNAYCS